MSTKEQLKRRELILDCIERRLLQLDAAYQFNKLKLIALEKPWCLYLPEEITNKRRILIQSRDLLKSEINDYTELITYLENHEIL